MKLNLFLLLCLTGLIPVALSILRTISHKYHLIMTNMTWSDAQNYCRVMYDDLAMIQSDTDWLRLKTVTAGLTAYFWTGLYNDVNSWRWSLNDLPLKNVTYTSWGTGQPDNLNGNQACVFMDYYGKWFDKSCTSLLPFICYDARFTGSAKFVCISNSKLSWFDAQTYCRTHHTELAISLNSSDNYKLYLITMTDSWIGLYRDTWKWSDRTNASNITWASGQPDNGGGTDNCAALYNAELYDEPCTYTFYVSCHTTFETRSQIMRLKVMYDGGSVFDPAVQSFMLEQITQKLKENDKLGVIKVAWKVQPDGNIFHKKKLNL